jgi:hypothetical protein
VCNEIWVIKDKKVEIFSGSFEDYKKIIVTAARSVKKYGIK